MIVKMSCARIKCAILKYTRTPRPKASDAKKLFRIRRCVIFCLISFGFLFAYGCAQAEQKSTWVFIRDANGDVRAVKIAVEPALITGKTSQYKINCRPSVVSKVELTGGEGQDKCVMSSDGVLLSTDKAEFSSHVHTAENFVYAVADRECTANIAVFIGGCVHGKSWIDPDRVY